MVVLALFLPLVIFAQNDKLIVGYYPTWRIYARDGFVTPNKIQYEKYDILIHFAFKPDSIGNIVSLDWWADSLLMGEIAGASYNHNTLIGKAKPKGTKILASIGGWSVSDNFPLIAAKKELRENFAHSCGNMIRRYGFDGIDIDWEFPTDPQFNGTPEDSKNFTHMMQVVRDTLDAIDKGLLLTGAFGGAPHFLEKVEWSKMKDIVDYVFMMTYNYNGPWSDLASHDSPLYAPAKGYQGNIDEAFQLITKTHGVPSEKVLIGISWTAGSLYFPNGDAALYASGHGKVKDTLNFPESKGSPPYYEVLKKMDDFYEKWDSTAQMPYLVAKDGKSLVFFDDERSVKVKAEYAVTNNAGGVFIWDMPGDYIPKYEGSFALKATPLVDILVKVLRKKNIKPRYERVDH